MSELTLWGEEIESNPLHHWKGFEKGLKEKKN